MKKSEVSGIAGTVRCVPLSLNGLYHQERHGKRLDKTSKARVIRDVPALTTTGKELRQLYAKHVEKCFIPRGRTKVIHVIIQWPKDLVDLTDPHGLLEHGIAFGKRVWGEGSIMGTRYDRDEESDGVVDLFVVPKYLKYTKADPKGKLAVSITKHGKELAARWGRMTGKSKRGEPQATPWDVGAALQDELYTYMRDVMRLEGVVRGEKKQRPGSDWKSPEELRAEELDEKERNLKKWEEQLSAQQNQLEIDTAAAKAASKSRVDDAEALAREIILKASREIAKWKADAETQGREAGYAAGFEEARAKLKEEQEAARKLTEAAEQKERHKQLALDAAMREAQFIRNEAQAEADGIRAKARGDVATQREAVVKHQIAIDVGLNALLDGDILTGGKNAELRRTLTFRRDLPPETKARLMNAIKPAWDWLSLQAERMQNIIGKQTEAREVKLNERHILLRDWARSLDRTATAQGETKRQLAEREEALSTLIQSVNSVKDAFEDALKPLTVWNQRFTAAQGPLRHAMQLSPKREIVEAAQAEPTVQAAQAADADYQAQLAAYEALKQRGGTGIGG